MNVEFQFARKYWRNLGCNGTNAFRIYCFQKHNEFGCGDCMGEYSLERGKRGAKIISLTGGTFLYLEDEHGIL